jgi:hydroxypyruvate isomerase
MPILLFPRNKTVAQSHYKGISCDMPKFIVNISLIFTEHPMLDRFQLARDVGFNGVEILKPYDHNLPQLAQAAKLAKCRVYLINAPFGAEWGNGANPAAQDTFRTEITKAVSYARALEARYIHIMSGTQGNLETLSENLKWASRTFPSQSFLIEPINAIDIPNYKLNNFEDAISILQHINAPNLGLQFDTYHASRILNAGDVLPTAQKCYPWIKHVQISGNPNRTEPDLGIVDHAGFFKQIDAWGYSGLIGAEYHPQTNHFDWMNQSR